ncbi:hypothetical protein AOLI_G00067470 [Acnodon oligacanthus]
MHMERTAQTAFLNLSQKWGKGEKLSRLPSSSTLSALLTALTAPGPTKPLCLGECPLLRESLDPAATPFPFADSCARCLHAHDVPVEQETSVALGSLLVFSSPSVFNIPESCAVMERPAASPSPVQINDPSLNA